MHVQDPLGRELPLRVREVEDGVYEIEFTPIDIGKHVLRVLYGGEEIGLPTSILVERCGWADKCFIIGRYNTLLLGTHMDCIYCRTAFSVRCW
jgi:hypothetical protein